MIITPSDFRQKPKINKKKENKKAGWNHPASVSVCEPYPKFTQNGPIM